MDGVPTITPDNRFGDGTASLIAGRPLLPAVTSGRSDRTRGPAKPRKAALHPATPYGTFAARVVRRRLCCRSSVVEHPLGKGEVVSSILPGSTRKSL